MEKPKKRLDAKRRMLLVLPLLILPFATLLFWSLGGGSAGQAQAAVNKAGFNSELPVANNKAEPDDKMGFYTQAEKDKLELQKQQKRDPYYNMEFTGPGEGNDSPYNALGRDKAQDAELGTFDPDERKVQRKLSELQKAVNQPVESPITKSAYATRPVPNVEADLQRLEMMLQQANQGSEDPQIRQVNELMESLLDLQHPERVQLRIKQTSIQNRGNVFPVYGTNYETAITQLSQPVDPIASTLFGNGFFGLDNVQQEMSNTNMAVRAVVHEDQVLINGSTIKLRLTEPVYINGIIIPQEHFVFGTVKLTGERLAIEIASIRYANRLFPVELNVYDLDGLEGIFIPGAISRDVAKQGGERAIQGFGMTTLDPSLGAQAASAGMEITRNLLSKKVKLVKVMVKAGYQVLLVDSKQNKSK